MRCHIKDVLVSIMIHRKWSVSILLVFKGDCPSTLPELHTIGQNTTKPSCGFPVSPLVMDPQWALTGLQRSSVEESVAGSPDYYLVATERSPGEGPLLSKISLI